MDARPPQLPRHGHRGRRRPPGFIEHNRDALGVPGLQLVRGKAPQALHGLERPDAIFIGGGVTREGVLDLCWAACAPAAGWWPTP
jgi:precorrin-6B methylase 2